MKTGDAGPFAEFPPTIESTRNAESESSGRSCFYANLSGTCDKRRSWREFSVFLTIKEHDVCLRLAKQGKFSLVQFTSLDDRRMPRLPKRSQT